ncbi:arginase family protein [Pseudonocardia acaciae]|uniref:arginase family protein n=1 Tax=Pseudonocardia acaciae TaxID=551276 RepID=UPI0007E8B776|nr:arginase family protein [Pseudonocardia acaciae]
MTASASPRRPRPRLDVVGNPNSAGSYAAGQDLAPAALRVHGLLDALANAGREVTDLGDLEHLAWRPDPRSARAHNLDAVVQNLVTLRDRLLPSLRAGHDVLVLGGNCTVALSAVAALRAVIAGPASLLYLDRHFDVNTPESTTDGSLDWMGVAHGLNLPGSLGELAGAFGQVPLLRPADVVFLGVQRDAATEWERQQADRLPLHYVGSDALAADPGSAAAEALGHLPEAAPYVLHLDVDSLDFTDMPLAESTDGRNSGPSLERLAATLTATARDPRRKVMSVGELNPTRCAGAPEVIPRFCRALADALAA